MLSFKTTIANHFMQRREQCTYIGFCQARDNEGNNLNRTIIFIEISASSNQSLPDAKEFAVSVTLPGTK